MTDFLTDYGVVIALACAGAAVVYGAVVTQRLLRQSPGNERMREISGAVQEGAQAYLPPPVHDHRRRRACPWLILLAILQSDVDAAIGFVIGGAFSGAAGFIGMNLSVRANARVAEAARGGVPPALDVAFKGGSVTGLLVVGLALLGVAGYFGILVLADKTDKEAVDALVGLGFGGSLISVFARSGRRHLHQGRRRRRRPGRQGRGGDPRGRSAQPGDDRRQRRRQRRRLRRDGRRPVRDLRGHLGGGDAARRPHLRRSRARWRSTRW